MAAGRVNSPLVMPGRFPAPDLPKDQVELADQETARALYTLISKLQTEACENQQPSQA